MFRSLRKKVSRIFGRQETEPDYPPEPRHVVPPPRWREEQLVAGITTPVRKRPTPVLHTPVAQEAVARRTPRHTSSLNDVRRVPRKAASTVQLQNEPALWERWHPDDVKPIAFQTRPGDIEQPSIARSTRALRRTTSDVASLSGPESQRGSTRRASLQNGVGYSNAGQHSSVNEPISESPPWPLPEPTRVGPQRPRSQVDYRNIPRQKEVAERLSLDNWNARNSPLAGPSTITEEDFELPVVPLQQALRARRSVSSQLQVDDIQPSYPPATNVTPLVPNARRSRRRVGRDSDRDRPYQMPDIQEDDIVWQAYDEDTWTTARIDPIEQLQHIIPLVPEVASTPRVVTKDCVVCVETKTMSEFPQHGITDKCTHPPKTCLECLANHIKTEIDSKAFSEGSVRCPECREALGHHEVKVFADKATFARFTKLQTDATLSTIPNFFWCPLPGCQSGQIHESGSSQPIVVCVRCRERFCFTHKGPWHDTMSCAEFDAFSRSPRTFKSRFQRENEAAEREREAAKKRIRDQEEADRRYAQTLVEQEEERAEAERQAEIERVAREEAERKERERLEKQKKKEEEARQAKIREVERKREEEAATSKTIAKTTKKCPGCKSPIEKNQGCEHMTCRKCRHEFWWCCLNAAPGHRGTHAAGCRGVLWGGR